MNSGNRAPDPKTSSEQNAGASVKACVVIPAFEAEAAIGGLVRAIVRKRLPVIVVDDASHDGTSLQAELAGATVLRRDQNGGKGMALREAFPVVLQRPYDWVITMDADGQHLPSEIPKFLRAAEAGGADLILGNRMSDPRGMPLDRRLTNQFMSWVLSVVSGQRVPDSQCGFRMISRCVLEGVRLTSDRFEVESELVVKAARAGYRIRSIPVSSVYRSEPSFIRPIHDAVRFLRFLFSSRRG